MGKPDKNQPKKMFVVDTNVILHNPEALSSFADNEVMIPMDVIEELDKFKRDSDERGRNAREAIRYIDNLRKQGGSLRDGVRLASGGMITTSTRIIENETYGLDTRKTDNRIVLLANLYKNDGRRVIFVSKDISARIKADALGITTMDFEKQKIDFAHLYSGWREVPMEGADIDRFYQEVGRGGRDGAPTISLTIATQRDYRVGSGMGPKLLSDKEKVEGRWRALWRSAKATDAGNTFRILLSSQPNYRLGQRSYEENIRWNKRLLMMMEYR